MKACERFGPDLLMLVHGDLDGMAKLRLQVHLLQCPHCRETRKQMSSLSVSLATAFRNPRLGSRTFGRTPRVTWTSVGILALLFSLLGWFASANLSSASTASSIEPDPCPLHAAMMAPPAKKTNSKLTPSKPNFSPHHCD